MSLLAVAVICVVLAPGVGMAQGIGLAGGYGAGGAADALRGLSTTPGVELLLFGGEHHDVFLGCLTCNKLDPSSLDNKMAEYGNKLSGKSLFNKFILYRNPYSPESACNPMATAPPVIVDREGKFYGELTRNKHRPQRVKTAALVQWLGALCAGDLD